MLLVVVSLSGCGNVEIETSDVSVKVKDGNVDINAPEAQIKTENGKTNIEASGVNGSKEKRNIVMIIDISGSMNSELAGKSKMDIVK